MIFPDHNLNPVIDARPRWQSYPRAASCERIPTSMQSNPAALHFADHFLRMVGGERFDPYEDGLSDDLERIACCFFEDFRPGFWYDGVSGMEIARRKPRQFRFTGEMWVAKGTTDQWLEPFEATCTDKRSTKEGIWIRMRIGEYEAEGDLCDLIAADDLHIGQTEQQPHKNRRSNPR